MKEDRLNIIEKRLIELEEETRMPSLTVLNYINFPEIEKAKLEKERQFILDERNGGWKSKIIWNIITPIIVTIITAYVVTKFNVKI